MKNNIYKKILFLFMAGALLGACVKEVDFSGAFKKKVVVNCILNNVYYEHHDQVTNQTLWNGKTVYRGSTRFSSALNGRQTLYLSYNKTDGDYEVIPDAEALLIDDNTGEIIGKFKKELGPDSNTPLPGRWTLDYSPGGAPPGCLYTKSRTSASWHRYGTKAECTEIRHHGSSHDASPPYVRSASKPYDYAGSPSGNRSYQTNNK